MAEGCCWYVVEYAPDGCSYSPDDIVTLPCDAPCEAREVTDPGPCQGLRLLPLFNDCQPCDGSITAGIEQAAAAARERANSNSGGTRGKPLSAAALRGLRKVSP